MKNVKYNKMLNKLQASFNRCLKLALKMATLTILNFKWQFVPQKWPGTGKGAINKGLCFPLSCS